MRPLESYLEEARALYGSGDRANAISLLENMPSEYDDDVNRLNLLGAFHASNGNLTAAETSFRNALKIMPDSHQLLSSLGQVKLNSAEYEEALGWFTRALAIEPDHLESHVNIASAYVSLQRISDAVPHAERIVGSQYGFIAENILGLDAQSCGDLLNSIGHFERAISINPMHLEAYRNLASTFQTLQRTEDSIKVLQQAVETITEPYPSIFLGRLYESLNRHEDALSTYQSAIARYPSDPLLLSSLGRTHILTGDTESGRARIEQALSIDPDNIHATTELCNLYIYTKEYARAYETSSRIVDGSSGKLAADFLLIHATAARLADHPDEAIEATQSILAMSDIDDESRRKAGFLRADIADRQGDYDTAFRYYTEANRTVTASDIEYYLEVMDDIEERFTASFIRENRVHATDDPAPVFIVGMPRSGTSLVEQILSSHAEMHGAGEITDLWSIGNQISDAMNLRDYSRNISEITSEQIIAYAEEYLRRIHSISPEASRVTDKLPHNFMHIGLINILFRNAKIIHCRRHPFDNCLSIYFKNFNDNHRYCRHPGEIARFYQRYSTLMSHWERTCGENIYTIQYESLIEDKETHIREMVDFLGLDWDESCLEHHRSDRLVLTPSFHQANKPIYRNAMARWKHYRKHLQPIIDVLGEPQDYDRSH